MERMIIMLLIAALMLCSLTACGGREECDSVIHGKFYLGNETDFAEALAIKDGKIIYVGDEKGLSRFKAAEEYSFDDSQLIIPGITDAHCHASMAWENKLYSANFTMDDKKEDYIRIITEFVNANPDYDYYNAKGWIDSAFFPGMPTAEDMEGISDKPIIARDSGGHSLWCNKAAMEKAGVTKDTPDVLGGTIERDADGNPTGCFRDAAIFVVLNKVVPELDADYFVPVIKEIMNEYKTIGYTAFVEALINESSNITLSPRIDAFEKLDKAGELSIYVQGSYITANNDDYLTAVDKAIKFRDETKGGNFEVTEVKVFLDGVVEGKTAYLSEPYLDPDTGLPTDNYGAPSFSTEEDIEKLAEIVAKANSAGMAVHFHAIGDQAGTTALTAIAKAAEVIGIDKVRECRNIIAHNQIVNPASPGLYAKYNVVANLNPWMCKTDGFYEETEVVLLGEDRASNEYPEKTFLNAGAPISFGTDYGSSFTYQLGDCLFTYINRMDSAKPVRETQLNPAEKLSVVETLNMMTQGTAYQMHKENELGKFAVGYDATLIVLNQDILSIPEEDVLNTETVRTMFKGQWLN